MIERVYYRVKLDANTFIYTPYLSNIPTSITDIPTNVTYDTTDGITLKTKETWTYDNNESSSVTTEREIPLKAGDGVTMDVSEDGKYAVIKVDPKRETHIGTSVPTDDYPDLFVNTADDSLSYKAPDGSWKPIAGGGGGSGGGNVDDVLINGVSIVVDKTANIPVDLGMDAASSNPIANKAVVEALNGLSTNINDHKNNKTNPHNVTAAQIGLGNVTTELSAVEKDISDHKKNTDNPHNVTAAQVGLGAVDNTSDADKPVSSKQAIAINAVEDQIILHKDNKNNPHAVTAAQVGLGNVNNTSDANKPVSTAQQTALDKKIDKAGGTFSGNVAIQGNLTVSGSTTTESETHLAVKENVIVTNADKANLQTLLSGLAINKNSTATYGIMYDPADDTVKFGEGTLDANRKFVFKAGEGHPLAIRADSSQFTDAVLVKWNATTKAFEPASGTWQDLLNKIEITDIDLTFSDETVLYNTTNGIQLSATGKITRKDGTSEQPQVDLDIPVIPGNGITIEKAANKEQIVVKVNTSVVALKSDLTSYAKTVDVVEKTQVGAANGVASLGADGKVPAAQLPLIDNDKPEVGVGTTLPVGDSSEKIFIKTDENYEGGGSGASVQADYNQNDSTAPDYIKNRPFYEAFGVAFNENISTLIVEGQNVYGWETTSKVINTNIGDEVKVVFNSVEYTQTVKDMAGSFRYVGNISIMTGSEDTQEPFLILLNVAYLSVIAIGGQKMVTGITVFTKTAYNGEVKIFANTVKTIDPKFIKDMYYTKPDSEVPKTLVFTGEISMSATEFSSSFEAGDLVFLKEAAAGINVVETAKSLDFGNGAWSGAYIGNASLIASLIGVSGIVDTKEDYCVSILSASGTTGLTYINKNKEAPNNIEVYKSADPIVRMPEKYLPSNVAKKSDVDTAISNAITKTLNTEV